MIRGIFVFFVAVVANYTYDAWGRLLSVKNASGATISDASHIANVNPIRYRGYFYDTETKLYYCNSRYYDPQVKRFINADVLLSTATGFLGYNMFAYCGNNPVVYGDQSGKAYARESGVLGPSGDWGGEAKDPITKHILDLEWKQYVIWNLYTHTTHNPKPIFSPESNSEFYIDLSDFWMDSKAIEHEKEDFIEDFVADLGTTDSDDLFEEVIYGIKQVGGASGEILLGIAIVVSLGHSKLNGVVSIWDGLVRLSDAVFEMIKKDG